MRHRIFALLKLRGKIAENYLGTELQLHNYNASPMPFYTRIDSGLYCCLHGIEHQFEGEVDWNLQRYGKLWNYQLQYLDFLLDPEMNQDTKKRLLQNISGKILDGTLSLEAYPVSMRLMYSLNLMKDLSLKEEPRISEAYKGQLAFLESHLEYHLAANHLLQNYIGLCFGFATVKRSEKLGHYLKLLLEALDEQILFDGAHYERSLSYHCSILSNLLCLYEYIKLLHLENNYRNRLGDVCQKMLSWMHQMTDGNRFFPLFNDCIQWPSEQVKQILEFARNLKMDFPLLPLKDSGFRKFQKNNFLLIINAGDCGPSYQPGHAHADLLSFVLCLNEKEIMVDPGISTYENNDERQLQKSTAYHNTVSFGKENQSELWASFRMGRSAQLKILEESAEILDAEVLWYTEDRHRRSFQLKDKEILIRDQFVKKPGFNAQLAAKFHLDHRIEAIINTEKFKVQLNTGIELDFIGADRIELAGYKQSFNFNDRRDAMCIVVYFCNALETKINWKQ